MRKTKIVCTVGPASSDRQTLRSLLGAGMNVARLNFSHGSHDDHRRVFDTLREVSEEVGLPVAVLQDLQGPKIRVGKLPSGKLQLQAGHGVTIVSRDAAGDEVPCTYPPLAGDVSRGDPLLIDDGRIELRVEAATVATAERRGEVKCRVVVGGELTDHKGINLPGVALSTPALTEKDRADLVVGQDLGVDFVALSFVRSAADCREARALLGATPLLAKIEKPEAVEQIDEILGEVDGIMVARGDLGVEVGAAEVPLLQKTLIEQANRRGLLVITATEMLDSMRHRPRPTRAEASDVANAILDGTDAVMLSGETAVGQYPLQSVETMAQIIVKTEASPRFRSGVRALDKASLPYPEITHAIARAAVIASRESNASTILCFTESGKSALLTSEYRPEGPILALTESPRVYRRLALHWGVTPLLIEDPPTSADETIEAMCQVALASGHVKPGDPVVITLGTRRNSASDLLHIRCI